MLGIYSRQHRSLEGQKINGIDPVCRQKECKHNNKQECRGNKQEEEDGTSEEKMERLYLGSKNEEE